VETKEIKLSSTEDVLDFVTIAEQCDFDIDIYHNRVIMDAKSFLGIMSLDISKKLYVSYNGRNSNFDHILKKYTVR
jgi:phosphotransferase system HPr-like phosphotransfer protein